MVNFPAEYGIREAAQASPVPVFHIERALHAIEQSQCRPGLTPTPSRGNFFKRLLSRRGNISRPLMAGSLRSYDRSMLSGQSSGYESAPEQDNNTAQFTPYSSSHNIFAPSPNTRPLACKPQPRDEWRHGTFTRSRPSMDNRTIDSIGKEYGNQELAVARNIYVMNLRTREMMAMRAAADPRYIQEWGFYLRCYSEGQHNLSTPPTPPPRHSKFEYLSAPPSSKEAQRLAAVRRLGSLCSSEALERAERIALEAKSFFQTEYASISLVEWKSEVTKVGCGYNQIAVPRKQSIGAHVILSSDLHSVMVLNDATRDWRMKKHPLVRGPPYIKFYAGVSLVFDGQPVGVLSIFDPAPRGAFTSTMRQKLHELAEVVTQGFMELLRDRQPREQHIELFNKGLLLDTSSTTAIASISGNRNKVNEEKPRTERRIAQMTARVELQSQDQVHGFGYNTSVTTDTPPPSDHSIDNSPNASDSSVPICRFSALEQVPGNSDGLSQLTNHRGRSNGIGEIKTPPQTPPRPFSACVVEPPTPGRLQGITTGGKLTIIPPPPYRRRENDYTSPTESPLAGSTVTSTPNAASASSFRQDDRIARSPNSRKPVSEATMDLSLLTLKSDYDLIYLLRVRTFHDSKQEEDRESVATQLLFSHGMPDPYPTFDGPLHLHALRSAGGILYKNPKQEINKDPIAYTSGIIIPILRDESAESLVEDVKSKELDEGNEYCSASRSCIGGIVLAAFNKQPGDANDFNDDVVNHIAKVGSSLKDILIRDG